MAVKKEILDLDKCVVNGLQFFKDKALPELSIGKNENILVVGSGNARTVGEILFKDRSARYADEGNYMEELDKLKTGTCVVISASGGKHSPTICGDAMRKGFRVGLITNTKDSIASRYADDTLLFDKLEEPYTYNYSTYMGMILSKTKENPSRILENLKDVEKQLPKKLSKYTSFYFILPKKFDFIKDMFRTKFDELFGPKVGVRLYTMEQTKHAKTIVSDEKELFISLGERNKMFGKNKLNIDIPANVGTGEFISIMYFIIGKIQKANKPYFKQNIEKYVKESSKVFGHSIEVFLK